MPQRSKAFNGNSSASNTPSMPSRTMPVRRTSSSHSITGDPPNTSWMDRLRTTANQVAGKTDSHRHDNLHSHAYPSSFNNINNGHGLQDGLAPSSNEQTTLKWPIVILALPPIGALFVGTAQGWSDGITLVFIGIYLYYLVKVPWELYHATQTDAATRKLALSANATPQQRLALASLRKQEWLSLFLVLVAPLLGGYALYLAKNYLMIAQYLTPSNIMLYVMVASMRPLTH
ncbi:hypothetical protein BDF19DRAFT_144507 [Syncephalis fuscata]|nr:hypothetical protein BDF19DRAFT_144507 [Syncephalis fuscata]